MNPQDPSPVTYLEGGTTFYMFHTLPKQRHQLETGVQTHESVGGHLSFKHQASSPPIKLNSHSISSSLSPPNLREDQKRWGQSRGEGQGLVYSAGGANDSPCWIDGDFLRNLSFSLTDLLFEPRLCHPHPFSS